MTGRSADKVTVPDVVGLPSHVGRDVAGAAGVALANPDPDGPPMGDIAWPGLFYITSQRPAAGAKVYPCDSAAVEVSEHGTAEQGPIADGPHALPGEPAHAVSERDDFASLADLGGDTESARWRNSA